jgi:hypothetical protein
VSYGSVRFRKGQQHHPAGQAWTVMTDTATGWFIIHQHICQSVKILVMVFGESLENNWKVIEGRFLKRFNRCKETYIFKYGNIPVRPLWL